MKTLVLFLLFTGSAVAGFSQKVTPEEAAKRVGDSITVCGRIFGGRFFETSNGSPTLLNMGAVFPNNPFTIMIPGDVRMKLGYSPETELKDKEICVTGRVVLYKNKPEMIVYDPSQIQR